MQIGIIGAGNIGATLARLWVQAGHDVMLAARDLARVEGLAAGLGPRARAGRPLDAALFGAVVLLAVPFGGVPALALTVADALAGKTLLDAGNPYPQRDGPVVDAVSRLGLGSGGYTAQLFPQAHVIKAFNTMHFATLAQDSHRGDGLWAVPLAGGHGPALEAAAALVRDAGFDPVIVGPIERSRDFDPGTAVFNRPNTAAALRRMLQRD
jgi:8-hydroxy-5-deazaflavin:NADPH oxidoreductase